jgi:hypothetical protein
MSFFENMRRPPLSNKRALNKRRSKVKRYSKERNKKVVPFFIRLSLSRSFPFLVSLYAYFSIWCLCYLPTLECGKDPKIMKEIQDDLCAEKLLPWKIQKCLWVMVLQVSVSFMTVLSNAVKSVTIKGILDLM